MDGRKRKAQGDATPSASASKKIKLLNSNAPADTTESLVQKVGLKLLKQLSHATDKTGRTIADAFYELPPEDELPDYYEQTKMPMSIDMIEAKVKQDAYSTITKLESDFKRLVQNAKDYNLPKSEIYEDAERVRKLVYNFMKIHNPQYQSDPSYSSFPTPFPDEEEEPTTNGNHISKDNLTNGDDKPVPKKPRLSLINKASETPSERKPSIRASTTPAAAAVTDQDESDAPGDEDADAADDDAADDVAEGGETLDFTGKSFQDAQQMIVTELLSYADDDGLEVFTPFANLPSRKLEDYYKLIRHPVSIKGVQKRTRGIHGRDEPTGVTDFKTWDAFEQEMSFIWRNAREYNEDGSAMYELADEFEEYFKKILSDAKAKVDEPAGPRIKIGVQKPKPGITLNLTQHKASPTPEMSIDLDSLARQRKAVEASVNGHAGKTSRPGTATNGSLASQTPPVDGDRPTSSTSATTTNPIKAETAPARSPAPPLVNGSMPPPTTRVPSGSPFPGQSTQPNGVHPGLNSFHYTAPAALPPVPNRTYPLDEALLPAITINTHPQLRITNPYSLTIQPHPALSHQSTTITLPSTHYYLQISPTISKALCMGRQYKMFVTVNGSRLTLRDTQFHADTGKRTHVYEGTLASGVNRIEVEVAAAKNDDGDGRVLDVEKTTVFANLMQ